MNQNISTSADDKRSKVHCDHDYDDANHLVKPHLLKKSRRCSLTSLIIPILLGLVFILGCILLMLTLARLNICRLKQLEQTESLQGSGGTKTWLPCVKTNSSSLSSCVCPATFIHSSLNPFHCIPNHSRCLKSCKHNLHCKCHNLVDPIQCHIATHRWIENELEAGPVEYFHSLIKSHLLQNTWVDNFSHQLERSLTDTNTDERLFLTPDRRAGIAIRIESHDYLLNERWVKLEINTTQQQIVYTQLDPQTHTCRMSSLYSDGSVKHGSVHKCPSSSTVAPYFFGVACHDILVLWKGTSQISVRQQEDWAIVRHNYESNTPHLPGLMDPFHRYYSLYPNSKIEIKDLSGHVLGKFFTDIEQATRFEFLDHYGALWVANTTHMQSFRSTNDQT
ncbi:unnamed protein product [Rotaria magnacalcarata]|uniref:Uncharacterized protein n=5 Tax=Rotaria magnacalcarata TaxID=392030 RepID=A0A815U146_9BILA|nr:unnamed protein product [Rotaria magnacalcarata]